MSQGRPANPVNRKLRVRFSKLGKVRFTSHRDVARIWERALRRANLPLAYTEGFSPRPKLSFGLALPTSYESLGEYLDINLRGNSPIPSTGKASPMSPGMQEGDSPAQADVSCEQLPALLNPVLPAGMEIQAAVEMPAGALSLQQAVTSCTWHIELSEPATESSVTAAVERVLAAPELVVTRERKGEAVTDDVRPAILRLDVLGTSLEAELATQPRSLRPAELVDALNPSPDEADPAAFHAARVMRLYQWTWAGGARHEVIPLPDRDSGSHPREPEPASMPATTQAPHALERAS